FRPPTTDDPLSATSTRESSPPRHVTSCGPAPSLPALTRGTSTAWSISLASTRGGAGAPITAAEAGAAPTSRSTTPTRATLLSRTTSLSVEGLIPTISTNQFKNGNHIEVEGVVFKILEFQHVKPGKGGAFVRTKLRRASDGAVIDRTFRAEEKFRPVRTEARKMQFLYADGTAAHFMDSESFEQIALPEPSMAEPLKWVKPNETVDMLYID